MFCFSTLVLLASFLVVFAQDERLAEIKYKEDYDRLQRIVPIRQPVKRAEQLVKLYKESPDMDSRLRDYADDFFVKDMQSLLNQHDFIALRGICNNAIAVRPKFGQAYFYLGLAYKNEQKLDEAMDNFAISHLIKSRLQKKAKQQLDIIYRSLHNGSLIGEDKIIKKAEAELK